jgi:hypothetical protein
MSNDDFTVMRSAVFLLLLGMFGALSCDRSVAPSGRQDTVNSDSAMGTGLPPEPLPSGAIARIGPMRSGAKGSPAPLSWQSLMFLRGGKTLATIGSNRKGPFIHF